MLSLKFLLCLVVLSHLSDATDKLRIGIKKRIENCTMKSRKGDLITVNYTVSILFFTFSLFFNNDATATPTAPSTNLPNCTGASDWSGNFLN